MTTVNSRLILILRISLQRLQSFSHRQPQVCNEFIGTLSRDEPLLPLLRFARTW